MWAPVDTAAQRDGSVLRRAPHPGEGSAVASSASWSHLRTLLAGEVRCSWKLGGVIGKVRRLRVRGSALSRRARHSPCPWARGFRGLAHARVPQTPSKCKPRGTPVTDSPQKPHHRLEPELISKEKTGRCVLSKANQRNLSAPSHPRGSQCQPRG